VVVYVKKCQAPFPAHQAWPSTLPKAFVSGTLSKSIRQAQSIRAPAPLPKASGTPQSIRAPALFPRHQASAEHSRPDTFPEHSRPGILSQGIRHTAKHSRPGTLSQGTLPQDIRQARAFASRHPSQDIRQAQSIRAPAPFPGHQASAEHSRPDTLPKASGKRRAFAPLIRVPFVTFVVKFAPRHPFPRHPVHRRAFAPLIRVPFVTFVVISSIRVPCAVNYFAKYPPRHKKKAVRGSGRPFGLPVKVK
jgi:hypothetical protein